MSQHDSACNARLHTVRNVGAFDPAGLVAAITATNAGKSLPVIVVSSPSAVNADL